MHHTLSALLLLSPPLHAAEPSALADTGWGLVGGWPGGALSLAPLSSSSAQEAKIGLQFLPGGVLEERWLVVVDWSEGCSNSFGGFSGTWVLTGDRLEIVLIEHTRAEALPAVRYQGVFRGAALPLELSPRP